MLIRSPGNLVTTVPEHNGGVTNGDGVAVDEGGRIHTHTLNEGAVVEPRSVATVCPAVGEFPGDDGKPRNRQR